MRIETEAGTLDRDSLCLKDGGLKPLADLKDCVRRIEIGQFCSLWLRIQAMEGQLWLPFELRVSALAVIDARIPSLSY